MFDFWSQKEEEDIMKQKMKKLVVVFLVVVMLVSIIDSVLPENNVYAVTTEQSTKLNSLRSTYPSGSTWNGRFDNGIQCCGFARLIAYNVFGEYASKWSKYYSINEVKAGDILHYVKDNGSGHFIFVTAVNGNTITYVDCNGDGKNHVQWDRTVQKGGTIGTGAYLKRFDYGCKSPGTGSNADFSVTPTVKTANIYKVEMSEVNYKGFKLTVGVSDTNLVKVRVQSVQTGEVLEPQAEFRSNFDNINYTFSTSQMKNPGKRFKVYIYAYNTDVAGSPEVLHRVTYNMTDSEKEVVVLPDKPVLYNVEKNLSSDMLVTTGDIGGWVVGNNIEKITAIINDKEYECSRCDRNDVAKAYPEYSGTNAGFNFKVNASMANNGDNTLKILAYVSNSDPILIYTGKFKATKLREDYFDWAWYYFKNHNDREIASIGVNPSKLREHYYTKGIAKGYSPCVGFDPVYYLKTNTDVNNIYAKGSYTKAYQHFVVSCLNGGENELRDCSPFLNLKIYKQNYADLKNMGPGELFNHYCIYGCVSESRHASNSSMSAALIKMFNPREYASLNTDVKNVNGDGSTVESSNNLWRHFLISAVLDNEPRWFSKNFDMNYYKNTYGSKNVEEAFWRYLNSGYAKGEATLQISTPKPTEKATPTPTVTVKPTEKATSTPTVTVKPTEKATSTPTVTVKPTETPSPTISVDENSPYIKVSSVHGQAGSVVPVTVSLKNNPGITSLTLNLDYDTNALTLQSVENAKLLSGSVFTMGKDLSVTPFKMIWNIGTADARDSGELVTLNFKINDNVNNGNYSVNITADSDDIYNTLMENVKFDFWNGEVFVDNVIPGDVNGDGKVNTKDSTLILQYYAGWDVSINLDAADVNGDGKVNTKDSTLILQHYAGWDVELK